MYLLILLAGLLHKSISNILLYLQTKYFLFPYYASNNQDTNPGKNGGGYIKPGIGLLKGGIPLKGDSSGDTGGNC